MSKKGGMVPGNTREFWKAKKCNDWTFIQYYNRLVDLAISQFEWQHLCGKIWPNCKNRWEISFGRKVRGRNSADCFSNK